VKLTNLDQFLEQDQHAAPSAMAGAAHVTALPALLLPQDAPTVAVARVMTNDVPPVNVPRPAPGDAAADSEQLENEAPLEVVAAPVDQSFEGVDRLEVPVQGSNLIAGALPVDLDALERSAQRFFERLERLGQNSLSAPVVTRGRWLIAAVVVTAAMELAHRRLRRPLALSLAGVSALGSSVWTWLPHRPVPPTRKQP
jgi:hypothetical protein